MKRVFAVFLCAALMLSLCACKGKDNAVRANPVIGVFNVTEDLESAGQGANPGDMKQDIAEIRFGKWNVETGEITFEGTPAFTIQNGDVFGPVDVWDGEHRVVSRSGYSKTILQQDPAYDLKMAAESASRILIGTNYTFSVSDGVATLSLDSGETYQFQDKEGPMTPLGLTSLENLMAYALVGCLDGDVFTVVYYCVNPDNMHQSVIAYAKLDSKTMSVSWGDTVTIPEDCIHGIYRFGEGYVIAGNRFYCSGDTAPGCLDLETGEMHALTDVMDQLDGLIPNSYRPDKEVYGIYTTISGSNGDLVIGYVEYRTKDGASYSVDYAVRGDELVGGLYYNFLNSRMGTITTFDKNLQTLHVYTPEDIEFPMQYLRMELHDNRSS